MKESRGLPVLLTGVVTVAEHSIQPILQDAGSCILANSQSELAVIEGLLVAGGGNRWLKQRRCPAKRLDNVCRGSSCDIGEGRRGGCRCCNISAAVSQRQLLSELICNLGKAGLMGCEALSLNSY